MIRIFKNSGRLRVFVCRFLAALVLAGFAAPLIVPNAGFAVDNCTSETKRDECKSARGKVNAGHDSGRAKIKGDINTEFAKHRAWIIDGFLGENVIPAMKKMAEQLSAVGMQQVEIIGMFLDSKQQLETQRLFQELQAEAHKDYQPSEDFCWFGTNVRSMAASEQVGRYNALALNARQMSRHLAKANTAGADLRDNDKLSRWKQFTGKYCDPKDNNWEDTASGSGLTAACGASGGGNTERINIDIDYTRLIDSNRTLNVAFTDASAPTPDEEDVLALGNNLYGHDVLMRSINEKYLGAEQYQHLYMALRSVAAKRSVAENSYDAIVGLKSAGTSDLAGISPVQTREFLGALLTELGVPPNEVYELIGDQPSYYAQLELLAKKIYQNPDFYSNLYDKPANVKRKSVALKAIELMLDRAIFESQLRQEMATSVLLSARLRPNFKEANKNIGGSGG